MDFSETIAVYDFKVCRCSYLNEYTHLCEYQRSRSFIDLGPNLSDSIFLNFFSSITTGPIEAKFHVEPPRDGGTKVCGNGPSHMTKRAAMSIYVKNLKKILLWNRKADDLETWNAALSTWVLPNLFKWCPCIDLDLFLQGQIWSPILLYGKKLKQWNFQKLL